jgi:hypothetical protein
MDTTALADEPTVATNTPPTWSELLASRLADAVEGTGDATGRSEYGAGESEAIEAGVVEGGGRPNPDPPSLDHWWLLVAPLAGAVGLSAASVLFDYPLRTGTSPSGLLAFAVLTPFFLLCVAGTLALFRDASRLSTAGIDWSPNPWHYAVSSAVALTAMRSYPVVRAGGRPEGLVGFLVGTFVVALVAASILAGPVYLYRRRKLIARN